jgi:hypothetical protein
MVKFFKILILLAFSAISVYSQSVIIKRTDVDSSRYGFITATFTFGMDIYLQDLPKSNSVAFQLKYNKSNFVRFSQWLEGDYGVPQVVAFEDTAGNGRLIVAVSNGLSSISDSIKNPKVIHLEFVVMQTANNAEVVNFSFDRPIATTINNGTREIVELKSDSINYDVHGYVYVWPGDTDNNGLVDHLDFAPISQYVGFGSATKNMKSFKRKSGSAIWGPQRVLTWDSASVTYADCDGNGDITISDMLIVTYNIGKDSSVYKTNKVKDDIQAKIPPPVNYATKTSISIPLKINNIDTLLAVCGELDLSQFAGKYTILGIERGELFDEFPYNFSIINNDQNRLNFALGSYTKAKAKNNSGIIAYLIAEPKTNINDSYINIDNFKGITTSGKIVGLGYSTDITEEPHSKIPFSIRNNIIIMNEYFDSVELYNLIGEKEYSGKYTNQIDISNLQHSFYFLVTSNGNQDYKVYKIIR